jgi:pyruvate formate lyase activating enzyme
MSDKIIGRIYDIQGYSVHDGPGIRTTVFTKGCPLKCLWCHSPESQRYEYELSFLPVKCVGIEKCGGLCLKACPSGALKVKEPEKSLADDSMISKIEIDRALCQGCLKCAAACTARALTASGYEITVDEAFERVDNDRFFFRKGGGATISGGEPMFQFEFTYNLAKKLHDSGLHVCLDTTGFAPAERYLEILPYVDLFLYDLKHMDSFKHERLTGVPNELILSNARLLAEKGGALQIRVPVIPKLNASWDNLKKTAEFCAGLGEAVKVVQLLPYHSMGKSKYIRLGWPYKLKNVDPPDEEFMNRVLELYVSYGLPTKVH